MTRSAQSGYYTPDESSKTPDERARPRTKERAMAKESDAGAEHIEEPKGGRPGPADHGRSGGMATRENAPELTESDQDDA